MADRKLDINREDVENFGVRLDHPFPDERFGIFEYMKRRGSGLLRMEGKPTLNPCAELEKVTPKSIDTTDEPRGLLGRCMSDVIKEIELKKTDIIRKKTDELNLPFDPAKITIGVEEGAKMIEHVFYDDGSENELHLVSFRVEIERLSVTLIHW